MAFHRISSLPVNLRLSILSFPQASYLLRSCALRTHWQHRLKSTYSTLPPPPPRRFSFPRRSLWLLPIAGGLTLYLFPSHSLHLPSIFASPTLIPCSNPDQYPPKRTLISSPSEPRRSILSHVLHILYKRVWEPIRTGARFVRLAVLFVPVIVMIPMLLVGASEAKLQGDRWGAVWWYGLLVSRMEAAGPTFIKVRSCNSIFQDI